jgi:hypothetical protein
MKQAVRLSLLPALIAALLAGTGQAQRKALSGGSGSPSVVPTVSGGTDARIGPVHSVEVRRFKAGAAGPNRIYVVQTDADTTLEVIDARHQKTTMTALGAGGPIQVGISRQGNFAAYTLADDGDDVVTVTVNAGQSWVAHSIPWVAHPTNNTNNYSKVVGDPFWHEETAPSWVVDTSGDVQVFAYLEDEDATSDIERLAFVRWVIRSTGEPPGQPEVLWTLDGPSGGAGLDLWVNVASGDQFVVALGGTSSYEAQPDVFVRMPGYAIVGMNGTVSTGVIGEVEGSDGILEEEITLTSLNGGFFGFLRAAGQFPGWDGEQHTNFAVSLLEVRDFGGIDQFVDSGESERPLTDISVGALDRHGYPSTLLRPILFGSPTGVGLGGQIQGFVGLRGTDMFDVFGPMNPAQASSPGRVNTIGRTRFQAGHTLTALSVERVEDFDESMAQALGWELDMVNLSGEHSFLGLEDGKVLSTWAAGVTIPAPPTGQTGPVFEGTALRELY